MQQRIFYYLQSAFEDGEMRHPQLVMRELSEKQGFEILDAVPQTLFDGWEFWIQHKKGFQMPDYIKKLEWKPVGEA